MDGITVLYSFTNHMPTVIAILGLLFIAGAIIFTVFSWVSFFKDKTPGNKMVSIIATVFTILLIVGFFATDGLSPPETQYKIIIGEDVPYLDFTKHYEVISIEGQIYTVRIIDDNFSSVEEAPAPTENTEFETLPEEFLDSEAVG